MKRIAALLPVLLLAQAACDDKTSTPVRVLRRPLSVAVTCADASGTAVARNRCGDDGVRLTSWVLDADARGLSVAYGADNDRFDADTAVPGWTALPVGGDGVAVRSAPDSTLVLAALAKDDATGLPALAWLAPADLADGVALPRAPLPCTPLDLQVAPAVPAGGGAPVPSALLLLECPGGFFLSAFPLDARSSAADPRPGERRYALPARPLGLGVSADGTRAYVTLHDPDAGDSLARLDLSLAGDDAAALALAPLDEPAPAAPAPLDGCPPQGLPADDATLAGGAPAPTPDGAFVYVPLARPAGVAIFTSGLARVDANAPVPGVEGSSSALLARLGVRDIALEAPVMAVAMVTLPEPTAEEVAEAVADGDLVADGVRAYAVMQSGLATRLVVVPSEATPDPDNPAPHRRETSDTDIDSTALMPVLRAGGEVLDRGISRNPEQPSFGMTGIESDPERPDKSVYYGIRFDGNLPDELTERWDVTYEGVLPGSAGCGAFATLPGDPRSTVFEDPAADFCALGVHEGSGPFAGDVLAVVPDPAAGCDLASAEALEYRVVGVEPTRLLLQPAYVSLDLPPAGCLDGLPLRYELRASGHWTVVGTRSGFLHNRMSSGGACVDRPDADPLFTGRARTTLPADGGEVLQACPARLGDARLQDAMDGAEFRNPSLRFNILPGCRTDARFRPVFIPPARDTRLSFQVNGGFTPMSLALGGRPVDVSVSGTDLHVLDAGNGVVYEVDGAAHAVGRSWY